jgi:hypothetical protein
MDRMAMMIPDPWAIKSQLRNFKRRVKIYRTEGSKEILFGSLRRSVVMSKSFDDETS